MATIKNDLVLRSIAKLSIERTPICLLGQTGDYLPDYRAVNKQANYLTICKTPELAAKVALQSLDSFGVDAAYLFTNPFLILEAIGMKIKVDPVSSIEFENPINTISEFRELPIMDAATDLDFVMDTVRQTKQLLNQRIPLIGISAVPLSLMMMMVEAKKSYDMSVVRHLLDSDTNDIHRLLKNLSFMVIDFITAQVEAGIDIIQLEDVDADGLTEEEYQLYGLPYIEFVVDAVNMLGVPIILQTKGQNRFMDKLADSGIHVLGFDSSFNLNEMKNKIGSKVSLQGNFNVEFLNKSNEEIEKEVLHVLGQYGFESGHVFNLGTEIPPDTNPNKIKFLIDTVKKYSIRNVN